MINQAALKGTSFRAEAGRLRPRLILTVDGEDKTGKNNFAYTAPGPIASQAIDYGDEGVVQKHREGWNGGPPKEIQTADYNRLLPDGLDRRDLDTLKKWYREKVVEPFIKDYKAALKAGFRTIVWDTATEFWEVLRLSHFGKTEKIIAQMYTAVNGEWQELVRLANDSDTNLIMLHQVRDEWENYTDNSGRDKSRTTGRKVRAGNEKIGYLVQGQLTTRYIPQPRDSKGKPIVGKDARFEVELTKSRHNPSLVGMIWTDGDATFQNVATMLVPELPPETWE